MDLFERVVGAVVAVAAGTFPLCVALFVAETRRIRAQGRRIRALVQGVESR